MADENWITPAEAERFVASHIGAGALLSYGARDHLLAWIAQDQLRTMALEVTRWQDEPPPPAPPAPPPPEPADDDPDAPKVAYRLNGAFRLLNSWELPLLKSQATDYAMSAKDWEVAAAAGAGDGSLWTTSELTHRLIEERHPNARITYAGIRMSKADIERRIAVAGWQAPPVASEETNAKPAEVQPLAREGGRRPAKWWPDFAEELAVYIHEAGVPAGSGQEGQSALIDEIFQRMSARGKEEPARTTVQPVVRAILARLRSAGN